MKNFCARTIVLIALTVVSSTLAVAQFETRIAVDSRGRAHTFVRDTRFGLLRDAWRDESGLVWGDVILTRDSYLRTMSHDEARRYCESLGARLPLRTELLRLRDEMGYDETGRNSVYVPQALPHLCTVLYYHAGLSDVMSHGIWALEESADHPGHAAVFNGCPGAGTIEWVDRRDNTKAARCVRDIRAGRTRGVE